MEWMVMNMDRFFNPSMKLESQDGDKFSIPDNCDVKLDDILQRLNQDRSRWHFRRSLFMNRIISENLLPILLEAKFDRRVGDLTIKVLQELLTPIECLMPSKMNKRDYESQRVVHELQKAVSLAKKSFLDIRATKAILDIITNILQGVEDIGIEDCETVNHCLLLIRNLLHTQSLSPDHEYPALVDNMQDGIVIEDQLMWNLIAQRFDRVIIQLLTCPHQHLWNITMVQLISLMYREQQQGTMKTLINEWLESSSYEESGEDDENNPASTYSSDNISTSDSDSDSSGRFRNSKRKDYQERSAQNQNVSEEVINAIESENVNTKPKENNNSELVSEVPMEVEDVESKYQYFSTSESSSTSEDYCSDCEPELKKGGKSNENQSVRKKMKLDQVPKHPMSWMPNVQLPFIPASSFSAKANNSTKQLGDDKEEKMVVETLDESKQLKSTFVCVETPRPKKEPPKKPPDEKESGSGDSSETRPKLSLPKLTKGKHLPMQKRTRHFMLHKNLENQETTESSNSTGSECDERIRSVRLPHQKPHKMLVKPRPPKSSVQLSSESLTKRSKLLLRREMSNIRPKALLHHKPNQEDITNLLKEFTIDFILNGYSSLVQGLRLQVIQPNQVDLDKSHLLWLLTYFLRIAVQFDVQLGQVSPILSTEVASYLVYEGIAVQEDLEIGLELDDNVLPQLRRLHLVVTALREFFASIEDTAKLPEYNLNSSCLTEKLCEMSQLRYLFIHLIRTYRPEIMAISYLQDLVTIHHRFLLSSEAEPEKRAPFNIVEHLRHFTTAHMMQQYGRLLNNFSQNGEFVNDCIFTMMHHIAGTLKGVDVLLQPCILKTFLRIWREDIDICVDWSDLIDYVLRKCARLHHGESPNKSIEDIVLLDENILTLESQYCTKQDLVQKLKDIFSDNSWDDKVKSEVINQLVSCGYLNASDCVKICGGSTKEVTVPVNSATFYDMVESSANCETRLPEDFIISNDDASKSMKTDNLDSMDDADDWDELEVTKELIGKIQDDKGSEALMWIQQQVLEACYAKIETFSPKSISVEPIAIHFTACQQPVPIVPMTKEREDILYSENCTKLLAALGFHMPSDTGRLYPRIPLFWGPDILYDVALKFGPIAEGTLKFSVDILTNVLQSSPKNSLANDDSYWQKSSSVCSSLSDGGLSMESVSVCSMENNRSMSPSPASSENEEELDVDQSDESADGTPEDCPEAKTSGSDSAFVGSSATADPN